MSFTKAQAEQLVEALERIADALCPLDAYCNEKPVGKSIEFVGLSIERLTESINKTVVGLSEINEAIESLKNQHDKLEV
jgi:hypothetical protein